MKDNSKFISMFLLKSILGIIVILFSGCASLEKKGSSRLELIKNRDVLLCGVSGKIPGFSFLKSEGTYEGIDVDICKAMAAAILGDASKIEYRPLTAPERFTALKSGDIDILSRNTTFTLSRDAAGGNGVTFAPVIFHDGQALMVRKKSKIKGIEGLNNQTICVGSGTTTELNLNDAFQEKGLTYKAIKYQDLNQVVSGYLQKRCKAITSDRSQLAAARSGFKKPKQHIILDDVLSKEPLAPASADRNQRLSDVMKWVIYSLFAAEELGITMQNINDKYTFASDNPQQTSLRRFLGIDGDLGEKLGIENNFIVEVIKTTGNYAEIYERHLGPERSVSIKRGINHLYSNGGLHFYPPFN